MSTIKQSRSQVYEVENNIPDDRREQQLSETNIKLPNLKQIIKQTTLRQSKKIDQKPSSNMVANIRSSLIKAIRIKQKKCTICEEYYEQNNTTKLTQTCQHQFCKSCITQYLTYKINAAEQILCPYDSCNQPFSKNSELFEQLSVDLKNKFLKTEKFLQTIKNPNLKQCNQPNCQGMFDISLSPCICTTCQTSYCPKCFYKFHNGECQDYHIDFLQTNFQFRQCQNCKNVIEKNQGCNHITCRCGYQFCYLCGSNWDLDLCRLGINPVPQLPPAPPRPNRSAFIMGCIWTLRILLISLYVGFSFSIYVAGLVLILAVYILVNLFVGGVYMLNYLKGGSLVFIAILFVVGGLWFIVIKNQYLRKYWGIATIAFLHPIQKICNIYRY